MGMRRGGRGKREGERERERIAERGRVWNRRVWEKGGKGAKTKKGQGQGSDTPGSSLYSLYEMLDKTLGVGSRLTTG